MLHPVRRGQAKNRRGAAPRRDDPSCVRTRKQRALPTHRSATRPANDGGSVVRDGRRRARWIASRIGGGGEHSTSCRARRALHVPSTGQADATPPGRAALARIRRLRTFTRPGTPRPARSPPDRRTRRHDLRHGAHLPAGKTQGLPPECTPHASHASNRTLAWTRCCVARSRTSPRASVFVERVAVVCRRPPLCPRVPRFARSRGALPLYVQLAQGRARARGVRAPEIERDGSISTQCSRCRMSFISCLSSSRSLARASAMAIVLW